ncbi:MAG: HEPN domain-containing protein [Leptospiraceae bacterium]|nr:HEPN domain-containing protein [Leptospiraceae bacterium]
MDLYLTKWLFKALEDLRSAQHELKYGDDEMVTSSICFHSQQCIEKLLKAFLIYHGQELRKTHNLVFLQTECSNIDSDFDNFEFEDFNYYSVDIRYPDEFYIPEPEEAKKSFYLADHFKNFVLAKLGILEEDIKIQ